MMLLGTMYAVGHAFRFLLDWMSIVLIAEDTRMTEDIGIHGEAIVESMLTPIVEVGIYIMFGSKTKVKQQIREEPASCCTKNTMVSITSTPATPFCAFFRRAMTHRGRRRRIIIAKLRRLNYDWILK